MGGGVQYGGCNVGGGDRTWDILAKIPYIHVEKIWWGAIWGVQYGGGGDRTWDILAKIPYVHVEKIWGVQYGGCNMGGCDRKWDILAKMPCIGEKFGFYHIVKGHRTSVILAETMHAGVHDFATAAQIHVLVNLRAGSV